MLPFSKLNMFYNFNEKKKNNQTRVRERLKIKNKNVYTVVGNIETQVVQPT